MATTPTLTVTAVTEIFPYQADLEATVSSDGGAAVTERGFVYSTYENPTAE